MLLTVEAGILLILKFPLETYTDRFFFLRKVPQKPNHFLLSIKLPLLSGIPQAHLGGWIMTC